MRCVATQRLVGYAKIANLTYIDGIPAKASAIYIKSLSVGYSFSGA